MERKWPPKPHKYPVVFKLGNETTGLLKSVNHDQLESYNKNKKKRKKVIWETDHCFNFDVSFYLHHDIINSQTKKVNDFIIMLNGLNEIHNSHYSHYDRIGAALAYRNYGVALHPTPFHLNRTPYMLEKNKEFYKGKQKWPKAPGMRDMKRIPAVSMLKNPENILYNFEQTKNEIKHFAKTINRDIPFSGKDEKFFYNHFLDADIKLNLIGYSMEGLQALYTFLCSPGLFNRCILINSGINIHNLNPKPIDIDIKEWATMAKGAERIFKKTKHKFESPEILYNVLFDSTKEIDAFSDIAHKVLFISGSADKVARTKYLPYSASQKGLNVLEISGLEHPLHSPVFDTWFPSIVRAINLFLRSPDEQALSADVVLENLGKINAQGECWNKLILNVLSSKRKTAKFMDVSNNLVLEKLFECIDHVFHEDFLKYYIMSKRFFKDDQELLRAMERRERMTRKTKATSQKEPKIKTAKKDKVRRKKKKK